jgi:hypothetical protein
VITYPDPVGDIPGFGTVVAGNPLADGWTLPEQPEAGRLILFSGWLAEPIGQGLFSNSFQTWGPTGRAAFRAFIERMSNAGALGPPGAGTLCFRPHARHVLADPTTCLSFLRAHEQDEPRRFELLLDPVAMLTPDMLADAEDHLVRTFVALGDRADVPALLLSNAEVVEVAGSTEFRACPLDSGVLDADLLRGLSDRYWTDKRPLFTMRNQPLD